MNDDEHTRRYKALHNIAPNDDNCPNCGKAGTEGFVCEVCAVTMYGGTWCALHECDAEDCRIDHAD